MESFVQFFLFTTVLLIFTIKTGQAASSPSTTHQDMNDQMKLKQSTEFIKTSCSTTTYPSLCFSTLSTHANAIQTSSHHLANTAISISLSTARATSIMMSRLSKSHGLSHREIGAMRDCVEELGDSIEELQNSLDEMKHMRGKDFGYIMSDVQTWVSAALTNDGTCMDGFKSGTGGNDGINGSGSTSSVKNIIRGKILNIAHLTSNALALINSYASTNHA